MTLYEILAEGTKRLSSSESGRKNRTASLDAAILLAHVLNTDRTGLLIRDRNSVSQYEYEKFNEAVQRRLDGECVAYITGHKEFYGLDFTVNKAVLVPRPETEILVETAIKFCESPERAGNTAPRVLDLCTGSGAAAIALKHEKPGLEVWASDISAPALEIAKLNSKKILAANNPESEPVHFVESDLFENIKNAAGIIKFSLIMSNPPYIPAAQIELLEPEVRMEPRLALDGGRDGLDLIAKIIAEAPGFLTPKGRLLLEADPRQMLAICSLLEENNFREIKIYKDLADKDRVISTVCSYTTFYLK